MNFRQFHHETLWNLVSLFLFIASALCQALMAHIWPSPPFGTTGIRKSEIPGTPFRGALHRGSKLLFPGCFSPLPTRTQLHPQGPSTSLSLKPQTNSLVTAFALAAFSTFNSLFTSSVTSYPLPINASSTIRDLRFLQERINNVSKPL